MLVALFVLFPGIITVMNRPKETTNRLFLGLSFALSVWVLSNFLVDTFDETALLFTRITFASIVLGATFFWDFTHYFPLYHKHHIHRVLMYGVCTLVTILVFTPYFVPGVDFSKPTTGVVTGPLYFVFILYFVPMVALALRRLFYSVNHTSGVAKQRAMMVLLAIGIMSVWGSITNLVLPILLGNNNLAAIGTYSTVLFTGLIGYSMLRHHLFDIRSAIARAAAYLLTLSFLALIYLASIFSLSLFFNTGNSGITSLDRLSLVIFALVGSVLFQPIKKLFDRFTNAIFFRDAYDTQSFLDRLNDNLVGTIEVDKLISASSSLLNTTLKCSFSTFVLLENSDENKYRFFGAQTSKQEKLVELIIEANKLNIPLIRTDELNEPALKRVFIQSGVVVAKKMVTNTSTIGFVLFGEKKNGNSYSNQDIAAIDLMADELALAVENALRFEQIRQFNVTLQREVDDATRQLRRTNTKLIALDEAKDEFISMASHQLRTPLTSIKGYLSLVMEGDVGAITPKQKELLLQAFTSSQRMVYLISDLLNVSRLRTGKFIIEPSDVYLPEVIAEELVQVKEMAQVKKIKLHYEKPKDFPVIKLDDTKIRQVIMNFIDNAIHYTPNGGIVEITLEAKPSSIEFTVKDNGIGVPKSEQHHLFTKFYRAGNARKARPDGTGLGLFMAKKVIVASGGALIFRSKEGSGSIFGFSFPVKDE